MAKYQKYAEYKDSGVEWLDVIPSHWNTVSLKMLIDVRDGTHETPSYVEKTDNSYPLVTSKDVTSGQIDLTDCKHISQQDYESIIKRSAVSKGDILMPMIGTVGSPVLVEERLEIAIKNLALFRTSESNDKITAKFLHYFLNSKECSMQFSLEGRGGVQNFVSLGTLRSLGLPLISLEEQVQIANFLDHETAQIDTLIDKQQTLIQLLKEKRQVVISHAVTKGLNPNAPMKDSGVEWLGEVPEHWNVQRFKFLCDQIISGPFGSSITKDMYVKYGYKVYGQEQVIANDFEIGDYFISAKDFENLSRYKVKKGSILISCVGTFGKIAVFPFDAPEGIINPRLIQAKLNSGNDSFFIRELLKSETVYKQFELLSRGGTMGVINISILNEIIVATPNKSEQTEIYEYLVEQQNSFNGLIEKAESAIQLMQERRTALISAAVTGKIDVRGWRAAD